MSSNINNIDIQCAQLGREFAEGKLCARNRGIQERIDEKDITALLTVLETNGPYAMWLYAEAKYPPKQSKKKKEPEKISVCEHMRVLISKAAKIVAGDEPDNAPDADLCVDLASQSKARKKAGEIVEKKAENLHNYLFFQDILKRALIYAKYHAKAHDTPQGGSSGDSGNSGSSEGDAQQG